MTRNEKIAEKMGWDSDSQGLHVLETWDEQPEYNKLYLVKLLQQRMVDDGWNIAFMITPTGINASAWKETQYMTDVVTTEPQAIFELFCRVYGIPASE